MSDHDDLRCSVVIPTHERAESLKQVLDALRRQTLREFEVIVAVDGEHAPTRALSESIDTEYPLRWIFLPTCEGQAHARNVGVRDARAPYIAFLDDDTVPCPEWLERHILAHTGDGEWTRIVDGRMVHSFVEPDTVVERFLREEQKVQCNSLRPGTTPTIATACVGVNCSLAREAFLASGGFDETLRETDEDMELGMRMSLSGARFVVEPDALVEHRDTKVLSDYYLKCWRRAANNDVYRMMHKNQRTAQTSALTRLHSASTLRRRKQAFAWRDPERARGIAEHCRRFAEASESHMAVRLWRSMIASVEYWDEIRAQGFDEEMLADAIGSPVVTLLFHSLTAPHQGDDPDYNLSPQMFVRMLAWLDSNQYSCVPVGTAPARARSYELTFDDGYGDLYTELLPLVDHFKLRPMVFIVTGQVGGVNRWDAGRARVRRLLSLNQMREMQRAGVQFGSHTVTHPDLTELNDHELRREVRNSKSSLEDALGVAVNTFAYPFGQVDERVRAAVGEAGYTRAYTVDPGRNWFNDPLLLKRTEVEGTLSMMAFAHKVKRGASPLERIAHRVPARAMRVLRMLL